MNKRSVYGPLLKVVKKPGSSLTNSSYSSGQSSQKTTTRKVIKMIPI